MKNQNGTATYQWKWTTMGKVIERTVLARITAKRVQTILYTFNRADGTEVGHQLVMRRKLVSYQLNGKEKVVLPGESEFKVREPK